MEKADVLEKFNGIKPKYANVNSINLSELREYANATLGFDRKTMDTFYQLPIKEEVDDDIVNLLLEGGWSIGGDGETFVLYLNF